ncbi:unnamed protein product [Jaminaea pallidilutea]
MSNQTSGSSSNLGANVPYSRPGTPQPQHQLGFCGVGNMGKRMALNLAKSLGERQPPLPPLLVWNRTASKVRDLEKESNGLIKAVDDLETLGQACDVVFTNVADDDAANHVYDALIKGDSKRQQSSGSPHVVWVDTSTLYPTTTGELERRISAIPHHSFLSAPVFGPPPMAETAKLVFALAGPHSAKKQVAPFLVPAMGRKIMDFGANPERAASFKLIGNAMILSTIEVLSETMTLAEKTGVGADSFMEFVTDFFPAPSAIGYGNKLLNQKFDSEEGFTLSGGIKDASHIRRLATSVDCPLPIIDIAHQHLLSARANAPPGKQLDWSSLVAGQRISSGLPPFSRTQGFERQQGRRD